MQILFIFFKLGILFYFKKVFFSFLLPVFKFEGKMILKIAFLLNDFFPYIY